ncbi:YKR104W-like protein [Saccharomyces cerevisiae x Saccharomyces kudriavzevii VIN7]|uniref:YKR104W-like protein n=1 Tax=Saccharomyces cerevisiae x Saccharomyces kudriavzevii (strain VIN7) TaxID=1095631 RepID=H0GXU9_SACCK|nr:YKR104W-like protein [Saccharomyces cerevisiae x Saccharomyces kudriavzevii VIN7]
MIIARAPYLDAGLAGILLSNAFSFTETAQWIIKVFSGVELLMSSVERIKEYIEVPLEFSKSNDSATSPVDWPQTGEIEFKNLSLRYSPHSSKALDNVSFKVRTGTKVGIVGRTGAGKSSIIAAIYRLSDWESGTIIIDNKDIKCVSLECLRNSISCIPQNPTLFDGTIRSNLDPYNQYSDKQVFDALAKVGLIERNEVLCLVTNQQQSSSFSPNKFNDLNSVVRSGGSNLSQGQRQLLCLARSMLGSRKIMLIDEATASIDYISDAKIQKTIRETMENTTILTIAHRLRSVIDYNKILVMDMGRVKEYDHPYNLISDKNTIFHHLCEQSGDFEKLFDLAKASFDREKQTTY